MFDTEKFILVIQKKECIWNIHNADYRNRGKRQCWQEVCQEMYPDWEKKSASEKREKGIDLQKKWKNIKDRFVKDMRAERNQKGGSAAQKRKKYIFSEILQFLLPQSEDHSTEYSIPVETMKNEDTPPPEPSNEDSIENDAVISDNETVPQLTNPRKRRMKKKSEKRSFEQKLLNFQESGIRNLQCEEDEDLSFFKSILSGVRTLNDDQKTEFRIEVLQTLQRIKRNYILHIQNSTSFPTRHPDEQSNFHSVSPASCSSNQSSSFHYSNQTNIPTQVLSPKSEQISDVSEIYDT
jgi:hypothetical protein